MTVYDADGHLMEPEEMFAALEAEFYPRRPVRVSLPLNTARGSRDALWAFEGRVLPSLGGRGTVNFYLPGDTHSRGLAASVGAQDLSDPAARLEDLDEFGIDKQAIFPTLFLVTLADDPALELALFRAYNTYVANACARSGGRLQWAGLVPFRDPDAARQELKRISDLGATAVLTLGMVWDRSLDDPAFLPVFEAAADLDLPIAIHFGWGSNGLTNLFKGTNTSFSAATTPVLWSFFYLMLSGVLTKVPHLRVGFIETGAGWVPYMVDQVRRRIGLQSDRSGGRTTLPDPLRYFEEGRVFVACEHEEDLPYLVSKLGEDCLMGASDYPHGDSSADENFVSELRRRNDLTATARDKILGGNAERFFRS